jgi:hypothetical protein
MTIVDKLQYTPLQFQVHHMDVPAAMRVWRVASSAERDQPSKTGQSLRSMIETKIANSKTLPVDEAKRYLEELKRN